MAKRSSTRVPDNRMATAGAVAHALGNQTAVDLHAWANQPGMPDEAHSPEATQRSNELAADEMRAFNRAETHYQASHLQASGQPPPQPGVPSGKPRGFQIHKVQAAAQRAKGNQYAGPDDDGAD